MVYKHNSKRGQAAIEFLMTYGWMLLVVLIVGALIFSFVDFGSLLPNKVELSNNLRAAATDSHASANDGGTSYVIVTFSYSGAKQVKITDNSTQPGNKIVSSINGDEECGLVWVKNVDTDSATNLSSKISGITATNEVKDVVFLNGQTGIAEFNCSAINTGNGLFPNDAVEGQITIFVENAKTGVSTPSSGPIRLTVNE